MMSFYFILDLNLHKVEREGAGRNRYNSFGFPSGYQPDRWRKVRPANCFGVCWMRDQPEGVSTFSISELYTLPISVTNPSTLHVRVCPFTRLSSTVARKPLRSSTREPFLTSEIFVVFVIYLDLTA